MKESTDILSKYETKLKKLETRAIVKEAKEAVRKKVVYLDYNKETVDIGTILTKHLAMGDTYAKKRDMKRATTQLDSAYLIALKMEKEGTDPKLINKYINAIEKRAERYLDKITKNKDPKNYRYGDALLYLAKTCKKRLETGGEL